MQKTVDAGGDQPEDNVQKSADFAGRHMQDETASEISSHEQDNTGNVEAQATGEYSSSKGNKPRMWQETYSDDHLLLKSDQQETAAESTLVVSPMIRTPLSSEGLLADHLSVHKVDDGYDARSEESFEDLNKVSDEDQISSGALQDSRKIESHPDSLSVQFHPVQSSDQIEERSSKDNVAQLFENESSMDNNKEQDDTATYTPQQSVQQIKDQKALTEVANYMADSAETQSQRIEDAYDGFADDEKLSHHNLSVSSSDKHVGRTLPIKIVINSETGDELLKANVEQLMSSEMSLAAQLDSDTAVLQAYLNRKQANKTENQNANSIASRASLSHRRDSDAVRQALASPRMVLEDKDINSPTPSKSRDKDADAVNVDTPVEDAKKSEDDSTISLLRNIQAATPARRSTRKKSRIPPPSTAPSANQPTSIAVRSGAEPVILKRTDAQEIALTTRTNTRKNKGAALLPKPRLAKLVTASVPGEINLEADQDVPQSIVWADPLVQGMLSPEKHELEDPAIVLQEDSTDQTPKPRLRRLRRPGNGTPAKGLLTTAQLPAEVALTTTNPVQAGVSAKPRKLPSPRKIKFVAGNDAKENRLVTPKKSGIPVGTGATATRASGRKRATAVHGSTGEN